MAIKVHSSLWIMQTLSINSTVRFVAETVLETSDTETTSSDI